MIGAASSVARRFHIPAVAVEARVHGLTHRLFWQVRGSSTFEVDGQKRELSVGSALWIPAGTTHSLVVRAESVLLPMAFEASSTATTLRAATLIPVDRDLRTLFLAYIQFETSIIQPDADVGRQVLAAIESEPATASALSLPRQPMAREVAEMLRFNPGDARSLSQLAEAVHTSTRTIERAFVAETGMSLREWRIRTRIEAAQVLLRSDTSLPAIARRVGYTDVTAFHRVFKERVGMTPREFGRRFRVEP